MIDRVVIINDLSHAMGGASQLALAAAMELRRHGQRVTLLCGTDASAELGDAGVEVVPLGQARLLQENPLKSFARGIYNAEAARMVLRWVAEHDTPRTVYHVHGWSQILSPALFSGLGPVHERTLVHAHDFFFTCPNGAMFDFQRSEVCPATPMSGGCMIKACDRRGRAAKAWRVARQAVQDRLLAGRRPPLLLIHGAMAPFFARSGIPSDGMFVLPNPVVAFTAARVPAERNGDILFVGRMEATKGIDLAAEACRRSGTRLVAIGSGALLEPLRARYPEMAWLGHCSHDQIMEHALRARLAIMPSRHIEPFGLAAVEALWSGLPVLSSPNALIAADIQTSGAGLSIDPTDIAGFAAVLADLSRDDHRIRQMSKRAIGHTSQLAQSPEQWIDTLLHTYAAFLDGGRPGLTRLAQSRIVGLSACDPIHDRGDDPGAPEERLSIGSAIPRVGPLSGAITGA